MKNITLFALLNISLVAMHMNASQQGHAKSKLQALLNRNHIESNPECCPENFEMIVTFNPPGHGFTGKDITHIILPNGSRAYMFSSVVLSGFGTPWNQPRLQEQERLAHEEDITLQSVASNLNQKTRVWGVTKKSALLLNVVDSDELHEQ